MLRTFSRRDEPAPLPTDTAAGRDDATFLASGSASLIDREDRLQRKTRAVVVMPRERWPQILSELDSIGIEAWPAETCQQARKLLQDKSRVEVVLSDLSLTDGNWCNVFKHLIDNDIHASMVVIAQQADERLWSEVLWRGAHDLLVEPYEDGDVRQVVEGALRAVKIQPARALESSPAALAMGTAVATSH